MFAGVQKTYHYHSRPPVDTGAEIYIHHLPDSKVKFDTDINSSFLLSAGEMALHLFAKQKEIEVHIFRAWANSPERLVKNALRK